MSTMRLLLWVFLTATFLLEGCEGSDAKLPGFKTRITKKGIDYANQVAREKLFKQLLALKIPGQNIKDGHKEYSLWNIDILTATAPGTSLDLSPATNGLIWQMANLDINLHLEWRAKYKRGWFKASTSGSAYVNLKSISLKVSISVGSDANGRPTVSVTKCEDYIGDVNLNFHGGTLSFLLNWFKGTLGNTVRDTMKGKICQVVQNEVKGDGSAALSRLKMDVPIAKSFLLDYGLNQAPEVKTNYLETNHKGEIYWLEDRSEVPFEPKPFPPLTNDTKMAYIWISDYMANSFAFVAQKHDFLQYTLTAEHFPKANSSYFNTSCLVACVGKLIPKIGEMYPNSKVEARIVSTRKPVTTMTKKTLTTDTQFSVSVHAHTPDNQMPVLLTLSVNLSLSLETSIVNEKLTGKVVSHKFDVGLIKSEVGDVHSWLLRTVLKGSMSLYAIPKLNEITKKGVDLPVTGDIKFYDTSIDLLDGSLVISTDLHTLT